MDGALEVLAETARWVLLTCSLSSLPSGNHISAIHVDCGNDYGKGAALPARRDYFIGSTSSATKPKNALFILTLGNHLSFDSKCIFRDRRIICGSPQTLVEFLTAEKKER